MKEKITQNERLQLIGLMSLAKTHYEILKKYESSMNILIGVDKDYKDHLSDEIYGSKTFDVDSALEKLGIAVED